MFRRAVKVCCFVEANQLKLQIFDVYEVDASSTEPANLGFLSMSPSDKDISHHFFDSTRYFNLWEKDTTRKFLVTENLKFTKNCIASTNHKIKYRTFDVTVPFPSQREKFLRIFGSLESVMECILLERRHKKQELSLAFQEALIDINSLQSEFLHGIVSKSVVDPHITSRALVDKIAAWILSTAAQSPELIREYETVITALKSLIANCTGSITSTIQKIINPHKEVEDYLKALKRSDPELEQIFNPEVSISLRTRNLLEACAAGTVKRKSLFDRIETKFPLIRNSEKRCAHLIWENILLKVIGNGPASDGNPYTKKHSEIGILAYSNLILHTNGLIELKFHNTPSYKKYYAAGCEDYKKFADDLIRVCDFLELPLEPSLVSHRAIFFSEKASLRLINHGLHITRDYVKACLEASHHALIFKRPPGTEKKSFLPENAALPTIPAIPKDIMNYILRLAVNQPILNQDFNWAYNRTFTKTPGK